VRRAAPWWAVLTFVALAGCAAIPTSGAVHVARALPAIGDQETRPVPLPPGPTAGMTPTLLVSGFLEAMVDSDSGYAVARSFLAQGTSWNPNAGTTVYDGNPVVHRRGPTLLDVTAQRVGVIDPGGRYRVDPGTLDQRYSLTRSAGQWRISKAPAGVPLSDIDAQRSLQPEAIYFFNHAGDRVVPDPVLVPPTQPGLATTLIRILLAGPAPSLQSGVTTAVPKGVGLIGNVPIDTNGVAEVDLGAGAQQIPAAQLARLSAQIVWTLRQVSSVKSVRLIEAGAPLSAPGISATQPVNAWRRFAPDRASSTQGALAADGGTVVGIGMTVPAAFDSHGFSGPAVSADGLSVAALREGPVGSTVVVGPAEGPLQSPLAASADTAPVFDPAGDVFVVTGPPPRSTMDELTVGHTLRVVSLPPSLRRKPISAISVSSDGARMAIVAGPAGVGALYVGALDTSRGRTTVRGLRLVVPATQAASGVAWIGANDLVTTVRVSAKRRGVLTTPVDGYQPDEVTTAGLPADPTQVAAAPGEQLLVAANGLIWSLSGDRWTHVSSGADPTDP
jgi:Lipoprotein LpqB beta-propeller domain/Sporulation and spore germination